MAKIKMKVSVIVADTFHDFLMAKKSMGLSEKTIITYSQHFSAIAKHPPCRPSRLKWPGPPHRGRAGP